MSKNPPRQMHPADHGLPPCVILGTLMSHDGLTPLWRLLSVAGGLRPQEVILQPADQPSLWRVLDMQTYSEAVRACGTFVLHPTALPQLPGDAVTVALSDGFARADAPTVIAYLVERF